MPRLERQGVLDTSVAFKFFHQEEESGTASALLSRCHAGQVDFTAPELLLVEFVNAVWKKTRAGEFTTDEAMEVLHNMTTLCADIVIVPVAWTLPSILKNCLAMEHGAYDMTFVTLAQARHIPLITADRRLYRKASQHLGAGSPVCLLGDLTF